MHILFLSQTTAAGASSRARVYQWLPYLDKAGIRYTVSPGVPEKLDMLYLSQPNSWIKLAWFASKIFNRLYTLFRVNRYDLVVMQRETLPYFYPWLDLLIIKFSRHVIFDFDDSIFLYPKTLTRFKKIIFDPKAVEKIIKSCDYITVSTSYLAIYAQQYHQKVTIIPTCISPPEKAKPNNQINGKAIIGWIGSPSTQHFLDAVLPTLKSLSESHPIQIKLIGAVSDYKYNNINYIPWRQDDEWDQIKSFDIGIMPLPDNEWTRGKGGYKLLQYMAAGVPAVASPVGVNTEIIQSGENGFLASTEQEWKARLIGLIEDESLRIKIKTNGLKTIKEFYTFQTNASKWIRVLEHFRIQ